MRVMSYQVSSTPFRLALRPCALAVTGHIAGLANFVSSLPYVQPNPTSVSSSTLCLTDIAFGRPPTSPPLVLCTRLLTSIDG